ncbi:MAG: hypothetical protein JOY62_03600 [Acidobacteriaceae bacterium]|nr:hypothetical protein [Acidobacteriaceae bacterium]MBV9779036.1 hypothetical protein [Acidobacteriaceae bacterium]
MKFVKYCAAPASLFALALAVTTSHACAQDIAKGTFDLPFEAHWGQAVLHPGQYTVHIPTATANIPAISVSGEGRTVFVGVGSAASDAVSERSYLRLDKIGDTYVVREFNSGVTGRLLTFSVPKSVRNAVIANRQSTTVPVSADSGN